MNEANITRRGFLMGAGAAIVGIGLSGSLLACSFDGSADSSDASGSSGSSGSSEGLEGSSTPAPADTRSLAEKTLDAMTLDQKIAQLFIVTPEQLTGYDTVTRAGDATAAALAQYPVGGLCYFAQNITGQEQLVDMLANTTQYSAQAGAGVPAFLSVDEEGGPLVARVANSGYFDVEQFSNMADIGAAGDASQAAHVGSVIGAYLAQIGFNLDFAPDADVLTNPDNQVIGQRSFGSDPQVVADMVSAEVAAFLETKTLPCVKHFPGHGDTAGDSHTGAVSSDRTREEIESCEFLPFEAAIKAGCPFIMVGHIQTPNFAADGLPASLSSVMMRDVLRTQLGFTGVIVSDSFSMGAITQSYTADAASVQYLLAGGDMILMPEDLSTAIAGINNAISAGSLDESRLDESVLRVLEAKQAAGILA